MSERTSKPIHVALCLDAGVYFRYRAVLRHLSVGLIDEVSSVRLLTSAKQAQALSLGPVQVTLYEELHWPLAHRRMRQMLEGIRDDPPSVVHAMSANSYPVAEAVATEFDADLVYQITALEDIDACVGSTHTGPKRVICASQPLLDRYLAATREPPELAGLIRPGVVCTSEPTCFLETDRDPTLLTTADLVPHAGVDQLIQAVALLRDRGHQLLAFLLGGGPEEHRLRELCQRLKLAATVVFAQPAGTALKAMVGADIFVQPGWSTRSQPAVFRRWDRGWLSWGSAAECTMPTFRMRRPCWLSAPKHPCWPTPSNSCSRTTRGPRRWRRAPSPT
jgi:glycosyltransferase involved in cell wall biosynthesis